MDSDLAVEDAADLLNISEEALIRLLYDGNISYRHVGIDCFVGWEAVPATSGIATMRAGLPFATSWCMIRNFKSDS
jgi:hypothetical protein